MRRLLILAAVGIVLCAHSWILLSVLRNRTDSPGGAVELTERELYLPPLSGESTAIFLELRWDALSAWPDRHEAPRWLDASKLAELGFDCSVPVTAPDASAHYHSVMPAVVFAVLEYEGEAWKLSPIDRKRKTRLFAVDAGTDPLLLRRTYGDASRYVITRALVTLRFHQHSIPGGEPLVEPRIQGWIEGLLPDQIFVPLPYCRLLEGLRQCDAQRQEGIEGIPRFAVTVNWGRNYEPWVTGLKVKQP